MQFLLHQSKGAKLHGEKQVIHGIRDFLSNLENLNLQVSNRASWELRRLLKGFEKQEKESLLSSQDSIILQRVMASLRNTVNAEIAGFEFFVTTPKRLDVAKLLNDPAALFAPDVFSNVTDLTRYDLTEAAKCIAFERPTAAAFHTLRATENVLREYYVKNVKRGRIKNPNWGPILHDLRSKLIKRRDSPKNIEILLNQLDYIRQQFRNPTQHPDKIYDIQEVQDLWSLCVDVINRMTK